MKTVLTALLAALTPVTTAAVILLACRVFRRPPRPSFAVNWAVTAAWGCLTGLFTPGASWVAGSAVSLAVALVYVGARAWLDWYEARYLLEQARDRVDQPLPLRLRSPA